MARITTPDAVSGQTEHTAEMYNAMKASINALYDLVEQQGQTIQNLEDENFQLRQSLQGKVDDSFLDSDGDDVIDTVRLPEFGLDEVATPGSENLITSGAVAAVRQELLNYINPPL